MARVNRLGMGAAGVLALAACAARAQTEQGPRVARASPPAAPLYSKDGSTTVHAPMSKAGYRAPVLVFVDRTREELQRATRLKLGSAGCPLVVAIGGKSDGDTRVLAARVRDPAGGLVERIELPDPEAADLGQFRRALCGALLRAWMVEQGGGEAAGTDALPAWLVEGVARHMDREGRLADADRAWLLWSRACLPPAADLFAFASEAAAREPAVAAALAGWLLDRRAAAGAFERVLRDAAGGSPWRPEAVARLLAGSEDPAAFDAALDRRFLEEARQVLQPGVTTAGMVRRFRSHLLLYPSEYGTSISTALAGMTFQEAAARAADPLVRVTALRQVTTLRMAAVGRDGMLLAVSEAYERFLNALARGAPPGELSRLLLEAERERAALERRVAGGAVLRREGAAPAAGAGG